MITEHECKTCGDHEWLDPNKTSICSGCGNGIMRPYKKGDIF